MVDRQSPMSLGSACAHDTSASKRLAFGNFTVASREIDVEFLHFVFASGTEFRVGLVLLPGTKLRECGRLMDLEARLGSELGNRERICFVQRVSPLVIRVTEDACVSEASTAQAVAGLKNGKSFSGACKAPGSRYSSCAGADDDHVEVGVSCRLRNSRSCDRRTKPSQKQSPGYAPHRNASHVGASSDPDRLRHQVCFSDTSRDESSEVPQSIFERHLSLLPAQRPALAQQKPCLSPVRRHRSET